MARVFLVVRRMFSWSNSYFGFSRVLSHFRYCNNFDFMVYCLVDEFGQLNPVLNKLRCTFSGFACVSRAMLCVANEKLALWVVFQLWIQSPYQIIKYFPIFFFLFVKTSDDIHTKINMVANSELRRQRNYYCDYEYKRIHERIQQADGYRHSNEWLKQWIVRCTRAKIRHVWWYCVCNWRTQCAQYQCIAFVCVCVYVGFLDSLRREVSCTYEWMVSDVLFFRGCCRIGWDCRNFSPSKNRLTVSIQTYFCSWWKCTVESTSGNSDHNIITVKDWYESFHSSSCRHLWTFPAQVDRQKTNSWFKNKPKQQRMCQNHRCRERMAE